MDREISCLLVEILVRNLCRADGWGVLMLDVKRSTRRKLLFPVIGFGDRPMRDVSLAGFTLDEPSSQQLCSLRVRQLRNLIGLLLSAVINLKVAECFNVNFHLLQQCGIV